MNIVPPREGTIRTQSRTTLKWFYLSKFFALMQKDRPKTYFVNHPNYLASHQN